MLLTSLLSLLALVSLAIADPLHISLRRRNVKNASDPLRFAAAAEHIRNRYGYRLPQGLPSRRAGQTVNIQTINQKSDSSYVAAVSVGTPSQTFNVVLDTGSSDLWLSGAECTTCGSLPTFDSQSSSSLSQLPGSDDQQVQIKYGSGQVEGTLAQDTISMGGFTVDPQTFLVVTDMSSGLLDGNTSGIMGLAFQPLAATHALPFWLALTNAGQFAQPEMAFWLTRFIDVQDPADEEPGGVFTLGGTNNTLFTGDIEFLDVPTASDPNDATFWLLQMTSLSVNGNSVQIPTGDVALSAIDTGTTLIGGPSQGVQNLYAAIPGSQALRGDMEGFFGYPCDTSLTVSISFGGKSWPISPDDMNLGQVGDNLCLGGVFDLGLGSNIGSGPGNPGWVIGDTFLKNVYSVFRSQPLSVGFAQLSAAAGGSASSSPASTSIPEPIPSSNSNTIPQTTQIPVIPPQSPASSPTSFGSTTDTATAGNDATNAFSAPPSVTVANTDPNGSTTPVTFASGNAGTPGPGTPASATFTQTGLPVPTGTFSFPGSQPTSSSGGSSSGALSYRAPSSLGVGLSTCAAFAVAAAMIVLA